MYTVGSFKKTIDRRNSINTFEFKIIMIFKACIFEFFNKFIIFKNNLSFFYLLVNTLNCK
jgi:hypothetical protein